MFSRLPSVDLQTFEDSEKLYDLCMTIAIFKLWVLRGKEIIDMQNAGQYDNFNLMKEFIEDLRSKGTQMYNQHLLPTQ